VIGQQRKELILVNRSSDIVHLCQPIVFIEKSWGCGESPLPRRVGLLMTRERDDRGITPIISYFGFHRWHRSKVQRGNHMKVGERGANWCEAKLMPTMPRSFFYFWCNQTAHVFPSKKERACFHEPHDSLYDTWFFFYKLLYATTIALRNDSKKCACFHEPHVSLHDTWFLFYKLLYVTTIALRNDSLLVKS
jgi:hypothetical protein